MPDTPDPPALARRLRHWAEGLVGDGWSPDGQVALLRAAADALEAERSTLLSRLAAAGAVAEKAVGWARAKERWLEGVGKAFAERGIPFDPDKPLPPEELALLRAVQAWEGEHGPG